MKLLLRVEQHGDRLCWIGAQRVADGSIRSLEEIDRSPRQSIIVASLEKHAEMCAEGLAEPVLKLLLLFSFIEPGLEVAAVLGRPLGGLVGLVGLIDSPDSVQRLTQDPVGVPLDPSSSIDRRSDRSAIPSGPSRYSA